MADIEYRLISSFTPIFATLREGDANGPIVQSKVLQVSGQLETFTGVTTGTYVVVGYDRAFGSKSSDPLIYATTTIAPIQKFGGTTGVRVNSIIETSSGNYLVGGTFTGYTDSVGLNDIDGVILLNSANGEVNNAFSPPTGFSGATGIYTVNEIVTGEYLIGGAFEEYSGTTVHDLVNVNADGTFVGGWSNWTANTPVTSGIYGAISGGTNKYFIFGNYQTLNNDANQKRVSLVNTNGSFDGTFDTTPSSFNNVVWDAIALSGGSSFLVVGSFTSYNGTTVNRIAVINSDGSLNVTETNKFGTGFNSTVYSIELTSTNQYLICGAFTAYQGTTKNKIVLIDTDGTIDPTFNIGTGFDNTVFDAIETSDNKYLVAGDFTTYNGSLRNRALKLETTGVIDSTFNIGTGFNAQVNSNIVETSNNYYLFGGQFTTYKGNSHNYFVKLDNTGNAVW